MNDRNVNLLKNIFVFIIYTIMSSTNAYANLSAEEVLKKISERENIIIDIQAKFTTELVEKYNFLEDDIEWGYKKGKEFIRGTARYLPNELYPMENVKESELIVKETVEIQTTFDGEKSYYFRRSSNRPRPDWTRGAVSPLDPRVFRYKLTPNVLMGYDVQEMGRYSLAEAILQAESFKLCEDMEKIDGRPCYIFEITSVEIDATAHFPWDAKVWIDPSRGFMPLKIEKHFGGVEGKNKFQVLRQRIDNIKLKQINRIWVPIEGRRSTFNVTEISSPEGMSEENFNALPIEEIRKVGIYKLRKSPTTRITKVDPNSVKINDGISDEKFVVKFPNGCHVFDEFNQIGYVVGESNNK